MMLRDMEPVHSHGNSQTRVKGGCCPEVRSNGDVWWTVVDDQRIDEVYLIVNEIDDDLKKNARYRKSMFEKDLTYLPHSHHLDVPSHQLLRQALQHASG